MMPHRSCAVEIHNKSYCYTLTNPRVFIENGCCDVPLAPSVGPSSTANAFFNKTTGAATGAVGVFTYDLFNPDLHDYSHIMAVMYSVPFDRVLHHNWFAVGIFERSTECNYALYDMMYNATENGFVRAKGEGSYVSYEGTYINVRASMSEECEAVLKVEVSDTGMY
ncbi:DELTA-stichotoxin-Hcr4b-like [Thalassophryne amazonica]|uniref:DELTA-stichotoxin-Hcr4b-like n=1 Tax=Thalassophryne amazonica TaxID=390379 RepID=UPI00147170C5|nr:DELTA-stichotoxin-Hcr4b-like [Thalassophryne amazonica]